MNYLLLISLLMFALSCGKSNSNAGIPKSKNMILPADGSNVEGIYSANFSALNSHLAGNITGTAVLERADDKFIASVRLNGGHPYAWHPQNIHAGSRCPNLSDDLNGDGIIDVEEANKVWGEIIIPLDTDINTQIAGRNLYPVANFQGDYVYKRTADFETFFLDFKTFNPRFLGLELSGKVAVVLGVDERTFLPSTVATFGQFRPHQTLPIACGVLEKVSSYPEVPAPPPAPTPAPTPPSPEPSPEVPDYGTDRDGENDSLGDRISDWWRRVTGRDRN